MCHAMRVYAGVVGETSRSCAVPAVEHAIEAGSLPTPRLRTLPVVRRNSITQLRHRRVFVMQLAEDRIGTNRIGFCAAMARIWMRVVDSGRWRIRNAGPSVM